MPTEDNLTGASDQGAKKSHGDEAPRGNGSNGATNPLLMRLCGGAALKAKQFPLILEIAEGYIVEGLTLLAGRPKVGKSWFALDVALAVSDGGACLGDIYCKRGDVLYLALEDSERRLRSRLSKILGEKNPWPANFEYAIEWPRASLDGIRDWIKARTSPRLVVIDVLETFRSRVKRGSENQYAADYDTIKALQAIACEFGVAILVVHHLRKGGADGDAQDKISGTLGLTGGADSFLIIDKGAGITTLYSRGRDIEEMERVIRGSNKDSCRWEVLGEADELIISVERTAVLTALKEAGVPLSPASIAKETGLKEANVRKMLSKLFKNGEVLKPSYGRYAYPPRGLSSYAHDVRVTRGHRSH